MTGASTMTSLILVDLGGKFLEFTRDQLAQRHVLVGAIPHHRRLLASLIGTTTLGTCRYAAPEPDWVTRSWIGPESKIASIPNVERSYAEDSAGCFANLFCVWVHIHNYEQEHRDFR